MNKNRISFLKKLTAGMLAIGMLVAVFAVAPKKADAAVVEDKVIYVAYEAAEISNKYWTEENKTAPVKAGYVFGGWFERVEKATTKTESDGTYIYNPLTTVSGDAFAKFVPAQVLSIKAQNGVNEGGTLPKKAEDISSDNPIYLIQFSIVNTWSVRRCIEFLVFYDATYCMLQRRKTKICIDAVHE